MSGDKDWRLRVDLKEPADLDGLVSRARGGAGESAHPFAHNDEVVLTHDGSTVFAYAPNETAIDDARDAIGSALSGEQNSASFSVSHWEPTRREWHQIDPPLTVEQEAELAAASPAPHAEDDPIETRPVLCVIGRVIRKSFEQQMVGFARELQLRCAVVEHPHLLSTQVVFNVTGPRSVIDEFVTYLRNQARYSSRLDPGLVPFALP